VLLIEEKGNNLKKFVLKILRFNALEVVQNTQGVLEEIYCWINKIRKPSPNPSQEARKSKAT